MQTLAVCMLRLTAFSLSPPVGIQGEPVKSQKATRNSDEVRC
jgi:hypothetical protein